MIWTNHHTMVDIVATVYIYNCPIQLMRARFFASLFESGGPVPSILYCILISPVYYILFLVL